VTLRGVRIQWFRIRYANYIKQMLDKSSTRDLHCALCPQPQAVIVEYLVPAGPNPRTTLVAFESRPAW